MDIDTFIGYLTKLVMDGCNLKFVRPLLGFTFTDKNGIYSKITIELHKLLLLQE